jgi:hypothetical protein
VDFKFVVEAGKEYLGLAIYFVDSEIVKVEDLAVWLVLLIAGKLKLF